MSATKTCNPPWKSQTDRKGQVPSRVGQQQVGPAGWESVADPQALGPWGNGGGGTVELLQERCADANPQS